METKEVCPCEEVACEELGHPSNHESRRHELCPVQVCVYNVVLSLHCIWSWSSLNLGLGLRMVPLKKMAGACVCVVVVVVEINNMYPSTNRALFSGYRLCSAIS